MKTHYLLVALSLFITTQVQSQTDYFYSPEARFDERIPTPEAYLGYPIGSMHTRHDAIVGYMRELARKSDRAVLDTIGKTYENRLLVVLKVTSPENHTNLEGIRKAHLKLVDAIPGNDALADQKPIVMLGYNVHGNEPSSSEAAMLTAYYYVAGLHNEVTKALEEAVLLIDPTFNPDGRDRHTTWVNSYKGDPLVSDPMDAEHNEQWPRGRTNHYWYDLNRDWLPLAHVESKARIDYYHQWYPNVVTDFHEMGTNSTYFFEPTKPYGSENPVVPRENYDGLNNLFAQYFHKALDGIGSLYFTKEVFDNSYPGYGSTYPDIHGGLGLVFEQASSRGHLQDSRMGKVSFSFTIKNHLTSSIATVNAAVGEKSTLLDHMSNYFSSAKREGQQAGGGWVFGDQADDGRNQAFVDLLLRHRIKTYALDQDVSVNGTQYLKSKAFYVPNDQLQYRMVRTMFEKVTNFYDSIFYDASAWTAALSYNMPYGRYSGKPPVGNELTRADLVSQYKAVPHSDYAYLIEWNEYYAPKALNYLLTNGLYVNTAFKTFSIDTHDGPMDFGYGTLLIPVGRQEVTAEEVNQIVNEATKLAGIQAYATKTGYSTKGIDLGSGNFETIRGPKALMVIGDGTSSYEAGEVWHLLDEKVGMPITKIQSDDLRRAIGQGNYNTLVLVSGNYNSLGEETLEGVKQWIRNGGTLITIRRATEWAISSGLIKTNEEKETPKAETTERLDYVTARDVRGATAIGGSMYQTDLDISHPLGFGYTRRDLPVYRNHDHFMTPSDNAFSTVVQYTENPLLGGYVSHENLEKIGGTASLKVSSLGRGNVILFGDNPNFRGMWYGTNKLFLNAFFFGNLID